MANVLEKKVTKMCPVAGCEKTFTYTWWARMKAEPEYCEEHRNEYRRALAEKMALAVPMQAVA